VYTSVAVTLVISTSAINCFGRPVSVEWVIELCSLTHSPYDDESLIARVHSIFTSLSITLQIVDAMGKMVNDNAAVRAAFGQTLEGFQTLVELYDRQDAPDSFLSILSLTVSRLAAGQRGSQNKFVDAGILPRLVELGRDDRFDSNDIRLTAVKAFLALVDGRLSALAD